MKVKYVDNNCNNIYPSTSLVNDGKTNMSLDLKMLDFAIENKIDYALLRFYQWYPKCVSFGRNQKIVQIKKKIDKVTRPTGGRALLHDMELTYCFVCPAFKESIIESYKDISNGLILGFKNLGIELSYGSNEHKNLNYCMNISTGADISFNNKKFIGSAQYRKNGYILQHGSIPYSLDLELINEIFDERILKENIVTLNEINSKISTRELIESLKEGLIEYFKQI